jgi:hypothetical protein
MKNLRKTSALVAVLFFIAELIKSIVIIPKKPDELINKEA